MESGVLQKQIQFSFIDINESWIVGRIRRHSAIKVAGPFQNIGKICPPLDAHRHDEMHRCVHCDVRFQNVAPRTVWHRMVSVRTDDWAKRTCIVNINCCFAISVCMHYYPHICTLSNIHLSIWFVYDVQCMCMCNVVTTIVRLFVDNHWSPCRMLIPTDYTRTIHIEFYAQWQWKDAEIHLFVTTININWCYSIVGRPVGWLCRSIVCSPLFITLQSLSFN